MQVVWERILNQPTGVSLRFYNDLGKPDANALRLMESEVRAMVKADFADLKEKQIKDLLAVETWTNGTTATHEAHQNIETFGFPMAGGKATFGKVLDLTDANSF